MFFIPNYGLLMKVKGLGEDFYNEDGTVDVMTSSEFESMRIITEHSMSAMMEQSSLQQSPQGDIPLRYLLVSVSIGFRMYLKWNEFLMNSSNTR